MFMGRRLLIPKNCITTTALFHINCPFSVHPIFPLLLRAGFGTSLVLHTGRASIPSLFLRC